MQDSDIEKIKGLITKSENFANVHKQIVQKCDELIEVPVLEREMKGPRLLETAREALSRIIHLSYGYRMTSNSVYAKRAINEMMNLCSYSDWNPSHFLDVSEILIALAVGYDWLYNEISQADKVIIVNAIKDKGFCPSFEKKYSRFLSLSSNWNSVCNAGLIYGALAVSDEIPDIAYQIIERSISSNALALDSFSESGGYPEGYNYWNYGTFYQVLMIDALESSFGSNFGLIDSTGFLNTGYWMQFMCSPTGKSFNFSDSPEQVYCNIPIWWFAHKTNSPSLVYLEQQLLSKSNVKFHSPGLLPVLPIFASRLNKKEKRPDYFTWYSNGTTPTFVYRGGWDYQTDAYLAIKGGSASTPHAHMDAGSFVYDYAGIRWAMDLGMQSYHSLESKNIKLWDNSQDGERWDIMRMRNDCHNTLTIDSCRHNVNATADILYTFDTKERKGAIVDLTKTLGKLDMAHREVSLDGEDYLHVIDSITTSSKGINLTWVMVTHANPKIVNNHNIILTEGSKDMILTFRTKIPIMSRIWENTPIHPYDVPNPGTLRVGYTAFIPPYSNIRIEASMSPIINKVSD